MMIFIEIYISSIILLSLLLLKQFIFPIWNHICILLLNDGELRGGGGLITQSLEIWTFFGVPYKILKHNHGEIHQYSEKSFYPFDTYVTEELLFRDTNFSFFPEDNFARARYFFEKNFPQASVPKTWISLPYSFIESIFFFPFGVQIGNLKISKQNLFRSLSHLVGDNELPPYERKFVLIRFTIRWIVLCIIPGIIHSIFWMYYRAIQRNDIIVWKNGQKTLKKEIYLGLNENNLKGRKSNRYMRTEQEYVFHVTSMDTHNIYGSGEILIRKILPSSEHFPFVGTYHCTFDMVSSKHFQILGGTHLHHECDTEGTLSHKIPFAFTLPIRGNISILRQSCIQNTSIIMHMDTPPFYLLSKTNLPNQIDHWHFGEKVFHSDSNFRYEIRTDTSPLRMLYRGILDKNIAQISFQKSILPQKENFQFSFSGKNIDIQSIDIHDEGRVLVFHLSQEIPFYPSEERTQTLKVTMQNLQDITGMTHYQKIPRVLWFPWRYEKKKGSNHI